ncbi:MAG: hypothetical protein AAFP19_16215, partial [Bacteroidota bacterium]
MEKKLRILLLLALLIPLSQANLRAQDNLLVEYESAATVPDFLNICGDPDDETVVIRVNGASPSLRQNIQATANLFEGVAFVALDAGNTTAGVTVDATDPNRPIFSIPDLSPSGTPSVRISFSVAANCDYSDTLAINDAIVVFDTWTFDYQMGGSNLTETDANSEYRDAFAVPSFTMDVENLFGPAREGDCFSRDIVLTNSGLDGFVDTIFYENVQGPDVYISDILVNGIPTPFTKQILGTGDTSITLIIDGTHFPQNTIGAGFGDGDVFFDPDETVRITENLCVLSCDNGRTSTHNASWGCGGLACDVITVDDFLRIGEGEANAGFFNAGSLMDIDAGYCQAGRSVVTFVNDGVEVDPGFGAMLNVSTGIGLGLGIGGTDSLGMEDNGFRITAMSIAGVNIPTPNYFNRLDSNTLFTVDPDGAGFGLEDLDGDGYFDDLAINESIELIVSYEFDCSQAQEAGADSTCANDFNTQFSAYIEHTNSCNDRVLFFQQAYYSNSNVRSELLNFTDPDAFVEEDTFYITHFQNRAIRFFDKNCGNNEVIIVNVVLPMGVSPIISETNLIQTSTLLPLLSNSTSNDTLTLTFDASVDPFPNGEYSLTMAFMADCTTPLGTTEFPTDMSFYCPTCDCSHLWFCGDLPGPTLHANVPPCPPSVFSCPEGLRTYDFTVDRTTFGYTDNTYTTPIDPSLANEKVAISCDSVRMSIRSVVGDTPTNDSIGVVITYDNIDETYSTDQTFLFDAGTLRLTNGGMEFFCPVDASMMTHTTVDSSQQLRFDLHSCLTGLGLTLVAGDTVEFIADFSLNPDGPYLVEFLEVPNFRAYAFGAIDGTEYACDNFGEVFNIAKNNTVFDFPNSLNFPTGCQETFLQYRLVTINNDFTDWFGPEIRQMLKIDSISFTYDPAILEAFSVFEPQVLIEDHPIHGSNFFSVPLFDSSGTYTAYFDTLTSVPYLKSDLLVPFNFRIRVVPNCKSLAGSSAGNNIFDFDPTIHFTNRYYAIDIGDGSCTENVTEWRDNDIFYDEPPTFSLTALSNPNFALTGDTAIWEIQHCNTSFESDAGLTWVALEDPSRAIEIVSIEDISDPGMITSLTVESYDTSGGYYFAFAPGLDRGDGMSTLAERCNTLRIKALVRECGTTFFDVRVGWNCVMYSEPDWNPTLYPPCTDMTLPLSVTTLDPFLDANIVEQPVTDQGLCDTSTIAILVRNTDRGAAFDIATTITLPLQGVELVPGSVEIAYPSGAAFTPVPTDPSYVGVSQRGQVYQYDDFADLSAYLDQNGLAGFNPISPTDSNEFRIRYQFVTTCDYVSGSLSYYSLKGLKGCGDSTNLETGETLPIQIMGANPGLTKVYEVRFDEDTALFPGETSTIAITAQNLTNTPTDGLNDKISLRLPLDVVY